MIDYKIEKHETYNRLTISVFGNTVAEYYYETGMYTDEYVKSTIVPSQLQIWLDN